MRRLYRDKKKYSGPMIGGPMHGDTLKHHMPVYVVPRHARPRLDFNPDARPLAEQMRIHETVEILGEYRWDESDSVWQWKTLIGKR